MMTRKLLAILLACALLFSLAGCQEEPKPVRPDPPSDWDEFLGRIIDPETQTFHLPDGDIWYDTAQDVLDYLELTEDDVSISPKSVSDLSEAGLVSITPYAATAFAELDICYSTQYLFRMDHLHYETIIFNDLTAADIEAFLESFQSHGRQITFAVNERYPSIDEFVQRVKEKSAINFADLPEEKQLQTESIAWTDENNVIFSAMWGYGPNDSEDKEIRTLRFMVTVDFDAFYEHIGVEPPSRPTLH